MFSAFDHLPAEIAILAPDGQILSANRSWSRTASEGKLAPQPWNYLRECLSASLRGCTEAGLIGAGVSKVLSRELPVFTENYSCPFDNRHHWYQITASPIQTARGQGAIVMHVDVTQLQRDSLTGLPNRALFDAQAQYVLDRTAQDSLETALIMLDLNRFKPINDTYGHLAGDYVLRAVAERLRDSVRDADFVARLGGDEFGLVLAPGTDFAGAHAIARRIGSQFDVPIEYDGRKIEVGASLGVALFPRDGTDVKGLLSIADARMYGMKGLEARRERGADQRTNAA